MSSLLSIIELPIMVPNNKGKFLGWLPWNYDGERKTQHATSVTGGKLINGGTITGWIAEFFIPYKLLDTLKQCSTNFRNKMESKYVQD